MDSDFNKKDLLQSASRLKACFAGYILSICLLIVVLIADVMLTRFFKENADYVTILKWLYYVVLSSFVLLRIVIIFRVRFVLQRIGRGHSAWLWQAGILLIPLLDVILPVEAIKKANEYSEAKQEPINISLGRSMKKILLVVVLMVAAIVVFRFVYQYQKDKEIKHYNEIIPAKISAIEELIYEKKFKEALVLIRELKELPYMSEQDQEALSSIEKSCVIGISLELSLKALEFQEEGQYKESDKYISQYLDYLRENSEILGIPKEVLYNFIAKFATTLLTQEGITFRELSNKLYAEADGLFEDEERRDILKRVVDTIGLLLLRPEDEKDQQTSVVPGS